MQDIVSRNFLETYCMSSFDHAEYSEIIILAVEIHCKAKMKNEFLYIIASHFYSNFSMIFQPLTASCFTELCVLLSVLPNYF